MINKEKWLKGQQLEREWHTKENKSYSHYVSTYRQYFKYLDIDPQNIGSIIEVGCADYSAISCCSIKDKCFIIEPLPSKILKDFCELNNVELIDNPAEEIMWPKADEATNTIRFFEPINLPIDMMHHHSFTLDFFRAHFGDCVKHYPKSPDAVNFHKWECGYGVYEKNN